jgi:hypothetical protein
VEVSRSRHEYGGGESRTGVAVSMDAETLRALEALPDRQIGLRERKWTAEEDAALLKHWPRAMQRDVAKLIGVSADTARRRYRFLTTTPRGRG